jgi:predicted ester cyclase
MTISSSRSAAPGTPRSAAEVWGYVPPNEEGTKLGNENIARFRRLVEEGINQGHLDVMNELLSPTLVDHQIYGPNYPTSRGGVKALTAALRTAFPDLHAVATSLVATNNGTQTFAIIKTTGTNTGPYLGIPATGREVAVDIVESARWADGKMVEHWGVADNVGLLTQLGFFPADAFPLLDIKLLAPEFQAKLASPRPLVPTVALTPAERLASVVRAVDVGVNTGDIFVDMELVSSDYIEYEYYGRGFPDGVDRHKLAIATYRTALPDLHTAIHQLEAIGDGTEVFGIMEANGTNTGPFLGYPASGRKISIDVFEYFHYDEDGKIDIHNGIADLLGLVDDMGQIPPGSVPAFGVDKVDAQFRDEVLKG